MLQYQLKPDQAWLAQATSEVHSHVLSFFADSITLAANKAMGMFLI
jgi:hypothetical protein